MRLENKVAVITGGASGIGRATALLFAREGAKVAIGDVADGAELVNAIRAEGGEATYQRTDVTVADQIRSLIDNAASRWGRLDVVFNNAGLGLPKSVADVTEAEFDRLFAVNVKGVFFGCKFALPYLLDAGSGSIINMSSNGGLIGRPGDPVYSASKHAVMGLTKSLATGYAHRGIRVNAICPGPIETTMFWAGRTTEEERKAYLPAALATCPAARSASADEVAQAALFLASDESRFISGVGLAVDGAKAAGLMPLDRYRLDFPINE